MSYIETRAMITVLPPTRRGSAEERLLARRSCARASLAQSWPAGVLVSGAGHARPKRWEQLMGDIGEDQKEYEFEPVEAPPVPVIEPAPVPDPELVPA